MIMEEKTRITPETKIIQELIKITGELTPEQLEGIKKILERDRKKKSKRVTKQDGLDCAPSSGQLDVCVLNADHEFEKHLPSGNGCIQK